MRCEVGGLASPSNEERRGNLACLVSTVFLLHSVRDEPFVNIFRDAESSKILIDLSKGIGAELNTERCNTLIRCFSESIKDSIVDIRVSDQMKPLIVLKSTETEKKKRCLEPCLQQRRHFLLLLSRAKV